MDTSQIPIKSYYIYQKNNSKLFYILLIMPKYQNTKPYTIPKTPNPIPYIQIIFLKINTKPNDHLNHIVPPENHITT